MRHRHTIIAVASNPHDVVAELAGVGPGHKDIHPAHPPGASQLRCHLFVQQTQFRWTPGVKDHIAATAGVFMQVLAQRGFVLHYVIDNTQSEALIGQTLTYVPAVFQVAGFLVTGPQLMALELMQKADHRPRDVAAIPRYRTEGHHVANRLISRCHEERRSSVYLNLDLDDDAPGLSLHVALSQGGTPKTIVVFRDASPQVGSVARLAPPPGIRLPGARRNESRRILPVVMCVCLAGVMCRRRGAVRRGCRVLGNQRCIRG